MANLTVLKKEGESEEFSLDKVIVSIAKAGMPLKNAEEIGAIVENWVNNSAIDGTIQSSDIRAKVLEEMKKVDPLSASTYDSYVK